jgi:hypothetical protein
MKTDPAPRPDGRMKQAAAVVAMAFLVGVAVLAKSGAA